ncbi:hypothetical protein C9374_012856 [Naegleria lovaniensis]|uniref:Uncharacterized protein n=1 Tax=Naegleria lovaniensis TaxID=51637 RepID=A0AA88GEH3_NAELO|nr:uncharacterized protein C9374_012856 [Naegleria lovaniensis]KAG2373124.1 hypothetical protein C9374_012856 [Naegleria lovaniensis]
MNPIQATSLKFPQETTPNNTMEKSPSDHHSSTQPQVFNIATNSYVFSNGHQQGDSMLVSSPPPSCSSSSSQPPGFTFVDMTRDVAFKIKYEGHKCLKVNKQFRNNETFQNNFFIFKSGNEQTPNGEAMLMDGNSVGDMMITENSQDAITTPHSSGNHHSFETVMKPIDFTHCNPSTNSMSSPIRHSGPSHRGRRASVCSMENHSHLSSGTTTTPTVTPTTSTASNCFFHFQTTPIHPHGKSLDTSVSSQLDSSHSPNGKGKIARATARRRKSTIGFVDISSSSSVVGAAEKPPSLSSTTSQAALLNEVEQLDINQTVQSKKKKKRRNSKSAPADETSPTATALNSGTSAATENNGKKKRKRGSSSNSKKRNSKKNHSPELNAAQNTTMDPSLMNGEDSNTVSGPLTSDSSPHAIPALLTPPDMNSFNQLLIYAALNQYLQQQPEVGHELIKHLAVLNCQPLAGQAVQTPQSQPSSSNNNNSYECDLNFDEIDQLLDGFPQLTDPNPPTNTDQSTTANVNDGRLLLASTSTTNQQQDLNNTDITMTVVDPVTLQVQNHDQDGSSQQHTLLMMPQDNTNQQVDASSTTLAASDDLNVLDSTHQSSAASPLTGEFLLDPNFEWNCMDSGRGEFNDTFAVDGSSSHSGLASHSEGGSCASTHNNTSSMLDDTFENMLLSPCSDVSSGQLPIKDHDSLQNSFYPFQNQANSPLFASSASSASSNKQEQSPDVARRAEYSAVFKEHIDQ